MLYMLDIRDLKTQDPRGLAPEAVAALAQQMLRYIEQQAGELQRQQQLIESKQQLIERKDREIALREARLEKVQFELTRLKRWKFGAKTEAMSAEQRHLFEETLAEDEAGLRAQLMRCVPRHKLPNARARPRKPRRVARGARPCPST
jgi:transposase